MKLDVLISSEIKQVFFFSIPITYIDTSLLYLRNMRLVYFNRYINIFVILYIKSKLSKSSLCRVRFHRYDLNLLELIELSSITSINN